MKYLILSFNDAGWFPNNKRGTKDRAYDTVIEKNKFNVYTAQRDELPSFAEPITLYHISNMLHVLFGERPKPSLRKSTIPVVEDIWNMAKIGFIKIYPYTYQQKDGEKKPITEIIKTKKPMHNAHSTNDIATWVRLKAHLGNNFDYVLSLLKTILKRDDIMNQRLLTVIELLKPYIIVDDNTLNYVGAEFNTLITFLRENKKSKLINLFSLGYEVTGQGVIVVRPHGMANASYPNKITLMGGIDNICKLSGEIIIPITDDYWINRLATSKGFATILDGGVVKVKQLTTRLSEDYISSFIPVETLSNQYN